MANVTRYDPYGELEDLFKGFVLHPVRAEQQAPQIKMDVKESDTAYVVRAEIPGVKKEDIKVDVDGNVSRSFTLAQDVDEKAANAKYADGVLELSLPKRSGTGRSKIAIQ